MLKDLKVPGEAGISSSGPLPYGRGSVEFILLQKSYSRFFTMTAAEVPE